MIGKAAALLTSLVLVLLLFGCRQKPELSPDEIPAIKETIKALEQVIRARNAQFVDSLISSDAAASGTTAQSLFAFVYSDGLEEFVGFTEKNIVFRGDAARIDCMISSPSGPIRAVTITLHKEDGLWLFKRIERRIDDRRPLQLPDSLAIPADSSK